MLFCAQSTSRIVRPGTSSLAGKSSRAMEPSVFPYRGSGVHHTTSRLERRRCPREHSRPTQPPVLYTLLWAGPRRERQLALPRRERSIRHCVVGSISPRSFGPQAFLTSAKWMRYLLGARQGEEDRRPVSAMASAEMVAILRQTLTSSGWLSGSYRVERVSASQFPMPSL